jgi:spore germination protein GerM
MSFCGCKKKETSKGSSNIDENPASSLVMTSGQADSLANSFGVKLYYRAVGEELVIAETALLDFKPGDKKISALAGVILSKLLEGPADVTNLMAVIPEGTEVREISYKNGLLVIDVNNAFVEGISKDEAKAKLVVGSIVNTLTELKEVEKVEFTCMGQPIGKLECGFEFVSFERNNLIIKDTNATGTDFGDPYAEELYEGVALE